MKLERLRIFISSPGDVAEERVIANNLVRRLSDEFEQQLRIEPVFWEHEPLLATSTFQKQIPPPRDCEVAICILWSRIGTRLPPDITRCKETRFGPIGSRYASGTEYEFEDAALGFEEKGAPDLLVYRKTAKPVVDLDDEVVLLRKLEQKKALDAFIQKWFFNPDQTLKAAFHAFATTAEFEQVLEEHLRKLIARRLPEKDGSAVPARPSWTNGSPFRGLQVFEFQHAPIFFGRTRAVGDLLTALRANAAAGRAFVLVVGVSGGGKSSLVRAGLLPLLTQPGVVEGVGLWRRAVMRPADSGDPIRSLAAALLATDALPELGADGTTAAQLAASMRENPGISVALLKGALSQAAATLAREQGLLQQPDARLVLLADQLEELFTLPKLAVADRQAFVAVLSALARAGKVWVVTTLRGDFYHRCFDLPELVAIKEGSGQFDLPLPTPAEIGQMIRQPAKAAGLSFEEEDAASKAPLDDTLREAAASSPESLPLLEFALEELYQRRAGRSLTYAVYRDMGGVEGALAQRAEGIYGSLPAVVQEALPRVMRGLVSVGTGDAVARQQAAIEAVAPTPAARSLVDAFVHGRLFSADRTETGQAVVQVAHEALLRNWPRVVKWLEQNKELLIVRARVSTAAARWIAEERRADLLLGHGKPLAEAEHLLMTLGDELPARDRELIAASQRRRRARRTAIALFTALAIVTGLLIRARVVEQRRATHGAGLVQRLLDADTAQVPAIVVEMSGYRQWADPLLRQERAKAAPNSRPVLHASLALLPVDSGEAQYLLGRLLNAEPNEVQVIRDALLPHKTALLEGLWSAALATESDRARARLRAASALAIYDPDSSRWIEAAPLVAGDLVRESPVFFGQWAEAFQPVKGKLLIPLSAIYRDRQPDLATQRSLATNLLAEYAAGNPIVLVDLLMDADENQFATIYPKLNDQPDALQIMAAELGKILPPSAKEQEKERWAKRRANAGVAMLRMNQPDRVWPLLRHSPDPRVRSYLIHYFAPRLTDPEILIHRLAEERDVTIRRALMLTLGEFTEQSLPPALREALMPKLREIYSEDDTGLHAAAEWLLREWKQQDWLDRTNAAWAKESRLEQVLAALKTAPQPTPRWCVNSQGQTMVVIPGPSEFVMGSPVAEGGRDPDETQHKRRIGRTFALSAKAVTVQQFQTMYKKYQAEDYKLPEKYIRMANLPVVETSWYQAALYCNWLSQEEGIPNEQWCYVVQGGQVSKLKANYLSLSGYRLPTEAEIEFATRAGAVTSRYYGETDELLKQYAWFDKNSQELTWPVGTKKPNDLGFFDLHGSSWTWCQESYGPYPGTNLDEVVEDSEHQLDIVPTEFRVLRGCSFVYRASHIRSACRDSDAPTNRGNTLGFRPARTLRLAPFGLGSK